ncbi:type I-E CRISPR-associated protein Cse2/CasB [Streptomyces hainanensis]|uniref:Type I-E CRISPR-associated protein Cse2/CasB n=1 Tax=Streptomyces hainanensis TaxID=402648 RepID=A0A4V2Y2T7_9ACTN|nr:type I-E CRISPR-associated protein Cse2/CasB [Streptomyces hainanensis]TDC73915.1 type I-E CRISPR-associated protein Cse2/CasB [Streptomyces hainanensis]
MTTSESPAPPPPATVRDLLRATVDQHVRRLQRGYRNDEATAVATLARLRRGVGRPALTVPDLLGLTGMERLIEGVDELPDDERRRLNPEHAEEALHLAVTLWALHQQSHRDGGMHLHGRGLGAAVRALMRNASGGGDTELDEPLRRRFVRVSTAASPDDLARRLREIVLLLRRDSVPLDYGLLAEQLYRWQTPATRADVHRAWGRDFHLAGARGAKGPAPAGPPAQETPAA